MADKSLFTRLKRLFSTDIILRSEGGTQLKVIDTNQIQQSGKYQTNSIIERYGKIHTTNATSLLGTQLNINYQTLRTQLYSDYDVMDSDAIVASSLDIVADESTLKNDLGEVIQIRSSDEDIQKILYNLFYDILNIEFNLWSWIRQMCKYGDFFLKLEIADKLGVYNVIPYTAFHIERQEAYDVKNPSSVRFKFNPEGFAGGTYGYYHVPNSADNSNGIFFDNYEMAHFRLVADVNYLPYGRSYLEPARKLFKQYVLMEDAMLIHRIVRAPEKRVYYLDIGNIPPNEVDNFMEKTTTNLKRTPYIDQSTGDYNLKYNMQNLLEDFYIPVRGNNSSTKIDTIKGLQYDGIEDVEYLRDKLFAALKVPKAFMGYEKDLCISPETEIPLLDGRTLTAQEIINEYKQGNKNYVYSLDEITQNIVPGEIEWAGMTRMNTQTVKVWLDNEEFIQCTPDHLFLTRDNKWKEAQHLKEGEALMPLEDKKINISNIEWVSELTDTCDLTISKYHNFGTAAGVIIHNSGKATLAAQDIRFGRTIDRIQRIILSELYKIALVHLYAQGYKGENLTNFELSLTTPSIIYDQEKIALLKEKVELARNIKEANLLPSDWIYDNIFHLSEDQYDEYRDLIREDVKRNFRWKQIENEGNDPLETGKSYGTPHDLAALYGRGRYSSNSELPAGYDENMPLGRPEEKVTDINTQDNVFGKDRLGKKAMKVDDQPDGRRSNSKLAMETLLKNKTLVEQLEKKLVFQDKSSLLDESQIKE